ncbi:MAG: polymer-forming cytoskeletal protein [Parvibaculum sp.]|uniref:polymer-forming cytoskeletal protein n=1 Tax=Parvibaculum sp. TaxID=2024848 RepID=UPI002ABB4D49|nr:polymer-forming cytoskeletal protein [Parvibaculum sp.]MDZ4382527.1 polymer-forming cytoskeletal protein [Parvibaculum sp.]
MRGIEIAVLTLMALMGAGLAPAFAQGPSEAATGRAVEWQTGDDVFAAAEELTFDRKVKGVLTAAGQIVILTRDAKIGGDTWIAARRVAVEGELEGDLSIRAQEALINGAVKGNVTFYGLDLSFGPDAEIAGNVTYYSPSAARIDKGAKVAGEINGEDFAVSRSIEQAEPRGSMRETWRQEHMNDRWSDRSGLAAPGYRMTAPGAIFFGALAVAFSFLAPAATARMRDGLAGEWAIAFGLGFLWLAGLPVLTVVVAISIIGLPIAFLLLLLWPLGMVFGLVATLAALGDTISSRIGEFGQGALGRIGGIFLATAIVWIGISIPILGALVWLAAVASGIGLLYIGFRSEPV